ncbi:metallophosphoesterase family protein [Mailhella sp.]|uniref:metallophosphoesterase family protein n=1 Tax=Mailhella sp. TaxID=1981029 RepID=UPI0040628741
MSGYAKGPAPLASGASSSMRLERFRAAQVSALPESPHTWVILGDLHGRVRRVREIPELEEADGVILTGDLTTLGGTAAAQHVIESVTAAHPAVFAQIGNMDRPEVNDWLEARGINLHRHVRPLLPNVALLGVGGSTFSPFGTPSEFPEARFSEWLEALALRAGSTPILVLAAHDPPYNTVCDCTSNGTHVGSSAIREFIEVHQPAVCLCGHIHESAGMERLGRTIVVNPGPFSAGCYALLTLAPTGIEVSLRRLPR